MRKLVWLDEKKDEIIELFNSGKKQVEIAERFDTSQTAISTRLRKWGISNPDGNRFKRFDLDKETIRYLYWDEENHPSKIAKQYGCSTQVVINRMLEWKIPFRTKSEARKGKLNPIYNVGHTKDARQKMSEAFVKGRKIGFHNHWGKGAWYDTPNQGKVFMKSGWESKTADYLSSLGLSWYYEYKWLDVGDGHSYLPDFYIPSLDLFIEVKGGLREEDIKKFLLARNKYNVILWNGEELLKLGIIKNSGSTEINRKYR